MRQKFSINTIREPDTYSAGASNPNSIVRWDQAPFWGTTAQGDEFSKWSAPDLAAESYTSSYIARPDIAGYRPDDLEWRMLLCCHWLIARIPEEGLVELVESLAGIYSFYQARSLPSRPLLPSTTLKKAVVRDTIERPPFELELSEG